jgi:Trk-type K+ transport system membrane component
LMLLEPSLPMRSVIFEVVSAVFSVGSSLGITNDLCTASRGVLCVAMFLGRVGLLSLLTGMFTARHDSSPHYPSENVIIN